MADTGWKNAGTGSGLTNSSNISSSNNTYATASETLSTYNHSEKTLVATNFGFEVPIGATITGVQMKVECKAGSGGRVSIEKGFDNEGPMLQGVSSNRTDVYGSGLSTTDAYIVFPPSSPEDDLWGATIGVSDVNNSSFGVSIPFLLDEFEGNAETTVELYVDNVQMKVFYEPLNTGWISPGTVVSDDTVGTKAWSNPSNAKASDNSYATASETDWPGDVNNIYDYMVKIVKGGSVSGTNKATNTDIDGTDTYYTFGGSSDLWGNTLTSSDINNSNFGCVISYAINEGSPTLTEYLKCSSFGLNIPSGSTINGVQVRVEAKRDPSYTCNVDHIQIKVYYTEAGTSQTVSTKARIKKTLTKTIQAKASIFVYQVSKPILVSPENEATGVSTTAVLVWELPDNEEETNIHSHIQIDDTDNTFGSLEHEQKSWLDQTGMEYWDGDEWLAYPSAGVDYAYVGNQARLTVTLTEGEKFWRVRGGIG
jgi:hypothetical protein